jgi:hypothetical protein
MIAIFLGGGREENPFSNFSSQKLGLWIPFFGGKGAKKSPGGGRLTFTLRRTGL